MIRLNKNSILNVALGILAYILLNVSIKEPVDISLLEVIFIVCPLFIMLRDSKIYKHNKEFAVFLKFYLFYLIYIVLQCAFRRELYNLVNLFKYAEILVLIYFVIYVSRTKRKLCNNIYIVLVIPSGITAIFSFYYLLTGENSKILVTVPLYYLLFLFIIQKKYLLFSVINIFSFAVAMLTRSRTSLLLLLFINIFLLFFKDYISGRQKIKITTIVKSLIVFITIAILISFYEDRIYDFFSIGRNTASNQERWSMLLFGLNTIKEKFFFGIGPGATGIMFAKSQYTLRADVSNLTLHNHFLEVFAELGVIGFLLFIGIISCVISVELKNIRCSADNIAYRYNVFLGIILLSFLYNLFLTPFSGESRLTFALIIGFIYASVYDEQEERL